MLSSTPKIIGTLSTADDLGSYTRRSATLVADVIEVRFDAIPIHLHEKCFELCRRLEGKGIQTLATLRLRSEGGNWRGSDRARLSIFLRALKSCSMVDVELRSPLVADVVRAAHAQKRKVLVSFHSFSCTPTLPQLQALVRRARKLGADIVKIATMTKRLADHATLFRLLTSQSQRGLCVIGMSHSSSALRFYLPTIGSCLAYGYLDKPAAPGQTSCRLLREVLT